MFNTHKSHPQTHKHKHTHTHTHLLFLALHRAANNTEAQALLLSRLPIRILARETSPILPFLNGLVKEFNAVFSVGAQTIDLDSPVSQPRTYRARLIELARIGTTYDPCLLALGFAALCRAFQLTARVAAVLHPVSEK
jgi:hypothetical protein